MESRSFTTAKAAELLSVSVQTVQKWVDMGHLTAWRTVGGHRRVDADSLQRMVEHRRSETPGAGHGTGSDTGTAPLIYLVDDNALAAMVLRAQIEVAMPQAQVQVFGNGFAALLEIGRRRPDLLVSDIDMPGLDGLAMLAQLRADGDTRSMPVILVTAYDAQRVESFGPVPSDVPLVFKPVDNSLLKPLLAALLRKRA